MRILAVIAFIFAFGCKDKNNTNSFQPPKARKETKVFNEQGKQRNDDYYWLNKPQDSIVIAHLKAENAYVEKMMKHTEGLQKKLYDEMVERIEQRYESLPSKQNGYWYYARYDEKSQYPLYCRKNEVTTAPEQIILDVNKLAEGHQIYIVRGRSISRDNNWMAFAEDTTGNRRCNTYFKNLRTGALSKEIISNTSGSYAWSNDNKTFYYIVNDKTVRPYKLMKHILGTDPVSDEEIYMEKDSTYSLNLSASRDNRYIFIYSSSTTTTEARYLDARNALAPAVLIQPRQRDLLYYPNYVEGNNFVIYNNHKAKNFKLSQAPIANAGIANWTDIIPHQDSALLENVEILQQYIVAQHKVKGLNQITVTNRKDNSSYLVPFSEDTYVANMDLPTDDFTSDSIRYSYTSLTTPSTDFGFNLSTKQKVALKQQKVGGGFKQSDYETKRIWATALDGTQVPISIVYKKENFKKDGANPLLLYAYGSYGASSDPWFNSSVISLLDRGFVFAIAHVRGGQEMGRYWYEDGKLLKKKNTFTDFIDCAKFLVKEKYTASDKLFANGGSAGGMVMGAVINLEPELFRGVIAEVPWMDVVTDMFDPNLPLVTLEYDEWGDPREKDFYEYMMSWSPYDNVKKANFPAILATGGLNDTQVPYFSPAKWVQKVRENNTGNNPVLFKCNMGAGHGGESGRFERQKLTSLKYAFMLDLIDKNK
jgi:oligopeptidase B